MLVSSLVYYTTARRWFLSALAAVYLCAFVSLAVQIAGLAGSSGILPVGEFLQAVRESAGTRGYWLYPTLAWLSPGDGFLRALCWGGAALSLIALLDRFAPAVFALLWIFYLSLVVAGQDFLAFQWDILLLEAGFVGILWAACREPVRLVFWLPRVLLFRLMFSSGVVKLAGGDPAWRGLTALQYHYETQPLPSLPGWYVHQLPDWFHTASCAGMFVIEIAVPFLIFGPRRPRIAAAWTLIALQGLIALTGSYAFFNLLTAALCLPLFARDPEAAGHPSRVRRIALTAPALLVLFGGSLQLVSLFWRLPHPLAFPYHVLARARIVGSYGLFAVMTTSRPEIIVEGSNDGEQWLPYGFRYKPGDLRRPPRLAAPHQPRLDWQMWFAALGGYRNNPWFVNFMVRLLEGSPAVIGLLESNPFPNSPPRYVRAVRYNYRFTDLASKRASGAWWRRERIGLYFPAASLRAGPDR